MIIFSYYTHFLYIIIYYIIIIMNIITNEHSLLNASFRSVPATLPIIIILFYFYNNKLIFLYLFLGHFIVQLSIPVFKNNIAYPIGLYLSKHFNTDDIPLIGRFKRPIGAANTGCFYKCPDNFSTTQGMPSGHCMIMAFICVFLYYYIMDYYNISEQNKIYVLLPCLLVTLYMMYTRVLMNAHTVQQTIVGSLIGIIFAHYYYIYVKNKIKKKISN